MGEEINADSVTRLIKAHLAKQKKSKGKKKSKNKGNDKANDKSHVSKQTLSKQRKTAVDTEQSEDSSVSSYTEEGEGSMNSFGGDDGKEEENLMEVPRALPGLLPRYQSTKEDDLLFEMTDAAAQEEIKKSFR
jgi:hypothetical protein